MFNRSVRIGTQGTLKNNKSSLNSPSPLHWKHVHQPNNFIITPQLNVAISSSPLTFNIFNFIAHSPFFLSSPGTRTSAFFVSFLLFYLTLPFLVLPSFATLSPIPKPGNGDRMSSNNPLRPMGPVAPYRRGCFYAFLDRLDQPFRIS